MIRSSLLVLFDFQVKQNNGLIRKIQLISKFMTSQSGKQAITIHILPNTTTNKGNQEMKFHQLREYNMRKIFLEKSYTKCGGETIPRPFSKQSNLSISPDQQSKVLYSLPLLYAKLRAYLTGYRIGRIAQTILTLPLQYSLSSIALGRSSS